jgi:hypothetical protein
MKLNPIQVAILAGVCSVVSSAAHAQATAWDPSWGFSGFGTLGYVSTNTNDALFAAPGQSGGVGKDGGFGPDSKIGAQVNAKANSVFSATVQAVAKRDGNNDFKPKIEWAFLKAQVTPELALRAGRIGLPFYMVSDYLNVNYSNLWVRPPMDVYGQVSFSNFTGGDAIYQTSVGSTTFTGQVFGGMTSVDQTVRIHSRHQVGLNLTAEFDNGITVRLGRAQAKITIDSPSLTGLVDVLDTTPFASVGDQLSVANKSASFTGAGISLDHDNWVGSIEYTKRKTASYISSTTGWAATAGYRLDKFTPYVVVSKLKVDNTNVDNTIPTTVPQLAPLAAAVDGLIESQDIAQKTDSVGVRWDAWKNIAVKAQYDRVKPDGGAGLFNRALPGFGTSAVNVYSASVDFVF